MSEHKEQHHHHKEHPFQAYIVLALFAAIFIWLTYGDNSAVLSISSEQFDLTKSDLRMIPITSLIFVTFWLLMQRFFFNPLLQMIEERESKTSGAKTFADDMLQEAQKLEQQYEDKMQAAQIAGAREKLNLISEARGKAQSIQEETQDLITTKLNEGRKLNQKEAAALKDSLLARSSELAEEAVKKITSVPTSIVQLLIFSVCFFACVGDSFAMDDGHAAGISHLTWYAVNFILYVALIGYLVKKPFVKFWSSRAQHIAEAVNRGELELKLAKEKLEMSQSKLLGLTTETLSEITNAIKKEGQLEATSILEQAKLQKEQMLVQSEQTLQAEKNSASSDVRRQVAEYVMNLVEDRVRAGFDSNKDQVRRQQALSGFKSILN